MSAVSGPVGSSSTTTLTPIQAAQTANIGNLHNKVALITGASSGLGRAIAQAYAAAGAYIVSADLRPNPPPVPGMQADERFKGIDFTTPTVELLNANFPGGEPERLRAAFTVCDVTNPESMSAAVEFTVQTYGRLDIMVNNAGIAAESGTNKRIHEQDVSILEADYAVNIKGVWLGCKYALAQMLAQPPHASGERGWVINMCSIAGLIGLRNASAYCASKGAVLQITKTLAVEYAEDQIHINCINPGFAETNFIESMRDSSGETFKAFAALHPWGRMALPSDIAKMAVFLAGEGASFVTGASFVVDGGYTAQ